MKFRDYFSLKHILFAIVLFAILIPVAMWDSGTQVKVQFGDEAVSVYSDKYSMSIRYEQIRHAELAQMEEAGVKVENGFDNDIIRSGVWENDAWGVYYANIDPDTPNCILLQLTDGRLFVFSVKSGAATEEAFATLQSHLSPT